LGTLADIHERMSVLNLAIIVLCGFVYFVMGGGVDVWVLYCMKCEAYVIMWVWIWWLLLWCGCIEFGYNCTVWFGMFL
jgi:hypothetical protein